MGGLDWPIVRTKIEEAVSQLNDVNVLIYEPLATDQKNNIIKQKEIPKMTAGRAVLIELIQCYLKGMLDPSISLLEVHKLLYFMQETGENLRLRYNKAHYGPYAENLRHVLNSIEGYYISGYQDGGDNPVKELHLIPGAVQEAKIFLKKYPETQKRFEKVSSLVKGFESPKGLELLSTVHWLIKYENKKKSTELIKAVYSWNERKKQLTERQIIIAQKVLNNKNWLNDDKKN